MGRASRRKRNALRRRPSSCLSCGATAALTREHIVARWVRRELERNEGDGLGRWVRVKGEAGHSESRDYARFDIEGNLLCQQCNNGWSSQLERQANGAALSLIRPSLLVIPLAVEAEQILAAWLAKMAILDEYVEGRISETFARSLISPIATRLAAPEKVRVWLGTLTRHRYFRHGWWRMAINSGILHAISTGDLLGLVVLPVEASPTPAAFAAHDEAFLHIWPVPVPKSWPPTRSVSIDQLNRAFGVSPRID